MLTPDGEYVFAEINPNGQWLWIEQATGLPIAEALADLLTDETDVMPRAADGDLGAGRRTGERSTEIGPV
jgi:hypothetical protein